MSILMKENVITKKELNDTNKCAIFIANKFGKKQIQRRIIFRLDVSKEDKR